MAAIESMIPIKDEAGTLSRSSSHGSNANLELQHDGEGLEYRMQSVDKTVKKPISLWHDVSLVHLDPKTEGPTPYLNFVCEIPKFSRKKYEIATDEVGNPIKQDEKKGTLREFKKGDIFFNYGCLPRTWEDPTFIHPDAEGCRGDNDPLDVCDIGLKVIQPGDVRPVKVLGILCMIDEGEADWKVVVIDAEDAWAPLLNDIDDVAKLLPGTLEAIREWFRTYKIPDGKPPNVFGLDEKFMDKKYAIDIIKECNHAWKELITGEKERELASQDEGVKELVRKLSKSNLLDLAPEEAAPTPMYANDQCDDEAPCF
eukprot:CAMPEP_0184855448 /NCGR_PEP_ID=MMETSP0580-20130426/695_1 /TAXON_ID=1118495 /ORGANISM="Dactyliosolen fragilissimus" /LENGTH=312 /DNA_ID=CAMNT_0027349961 /DNA_START=55 /DNA_END=993 /DNA_ORIENTATION=+